MAIAPSQVRRIAGQAPITPEIAQAYQNDPRTQIARASVQQGTSGAPVAEGQYAWADALARTFSAGLGAYGDKRMRDQYGAQDDQMVSERAANAQRQLAELEAEKAAKMAPGAPPPTLNPSAAGAIAGALGAPAPKTPPVVASSPMGAPPAAAPLMGAPGAPPPVSSAMPGAPRPAPAPRAAGVAFTDPLGGRGRRTSGYSDTRPGGRQHRATDWAAQGGTPVGAAAEGRVVRAWNDTANGGGNSVIIEHPDGSRTGYAHLANFNVQRGDNVQAGQPIGAVGNTGRSSGSHLHFTYRDPSGQRRDPSTLRFGEPQAAAAEAAPQGDPSATPVDDVEAVGTPGANENFGIPAEAMPTAPRPVGATQSRGLRNSLELAASGNPYESARAQTGIGLGYDQQTDLDERAAGRENDMNMTTYRSALDRYGSDRSQIRQQRYGTAERIGGQRFNRDERIEGQGFTAGQNQLNRQYGTSERLDSQAFTADQAERDRRQQREINEMNNGSREEIARARRQSTPAFMKADQAATDIIDTNRNGIGRIDEFLRLNTEQVTGTAAQHTPFGLNTFGNRRLQTMEALSNQLTTDLSTKLKGALSDKDVAFLQRGNLGIRNTPAANAAIGRFMRRAYEIGNEYQIERLDALANNDRTFLRSWNAYRDAVPLDAQNPVSFQEWKSSVPSYDANGNPQ